MVHSFGLPAPSAWIVTDGKRGDEVQCQGIAEALGLDPKRCLVAPRPPFSWLAPRGPIDPRDAPDQPNSPIAPPFPDILIASGRRTVPYMRHVKRASGGKTFTVYLKDPRVGAGAADVIWVPEHDSLRGDNVCVTAIAPHPIHADVLEAMRDAPDARIIALHGPRAGLILGGNSRHHRFERKDIEALCEMVRAVLESGWSLMVTPSRRTPPDLVAALEAMTAPVDPHLFFLWKGEGANPYRQILAHAESLIVTGDSTNMVGEALGVGCPVHVYEPSGGHKKITAFLNGLGRRGVIRPWAGRLEDWESEAIDPTTEIAGFILERYAAFRSVG